MSESHIYNRERAVQAAKLKIYIKIIDIRYQMSESLQTTGGKNSSGRQTENTGQNYRYQISDI